MKDPFNFDWNKRLAPILVQFAHLFPLQEDFFSSQWRCLRRHSMLLNWLFLVVHFLGFMKENGVVKNGNKSR